MQGNFKGKKLIAQFGEFKTEKKVRCAFPDAGKGERQDGGQRQESVQGGQRMKSFKRQPCSPHLLCHKVEEVDQVLGCSREARPQLLPLAGHTHRAIVGVAHCKGKEDGQRVNESGTGCSWGWG